MNTPDMWLTQAPDNKRFALAIGAGLLLELAVLGLALPMFTHQPPPAQVPAPVKLTIVAPPVPKPPPPAPKPPPPKTVTPPQHVAPPKLPPPPPRAVHHNIIHHVVPPRPAPPPPPAVQPPPPQTPPAPPQPPVLSQGAVDLFRLAMRQAVQSVANEVYPQAAQMAHETGTPEVTFTFVNGVVTDISLAASSGYPLLDAAAMQAARIAQYPAPPPGFAGRTCYVRVMVNFVLAAPSVDGD